jgi:TrmH family RNA methyltransferase
LIPIYKLEKLPRSQGLRKIARILEEAEKRLLTGTPTKGADKYASDSDYLYSLIELLCKDTNFSSAERQALLSAKSAAIDPKEQRRAINSARYIVYRAIGKQTADWDFLDDTGRLDHARRKIFPGMQVYLEDIRSPFNVGAMFRSAESFGVERVYLSPLCADPEHPRAKRTAMGCVEAVPWERVGQDNDALPCTGIFALETGGTALDDFPFPDQGVMIVGSEELGVSPEALALADASLGRLSIPTYGAKGSLNVSVAFGIALQAWASFRLSHHC